MTNTEMQSLKLSRCLQNIIRMGNVLNNSACCLKARNSHFSTSAPPSDLLRHLSARIKSSGPITVAEYMKEVLTNPLAGYYMTKDVFGSKGDFTTSPEISQMFGELLGVWCLNEWMQIGLTEKLQVVELGPGRGTLADDMLRTFSQFADVKNNISVHLVEVSPTLSEIQESKLTGKELDQIKKEKDTKRKDSESEGKHYKHCISKYGQPVYWYQRLQDVPPSLSCYIAHEFLDALPIYKFQKTERGWCEVLIDYDENNNSLKFVLSPGPTAASMSFLQFAAEITSFEQQAVITVLGGGSTPSSVPDDDTRNHIEVSPDGGLVVQEICTRIRDHQGFALLADYGHSAEKTDTFRAFKNHQLHDVLVEPGSADLTADVDFTYLKHMTKGIVNTYGPITQQEFLHNMGIGVRLQVLLEKARSENWKDLISGFDMLTNPKKMGERFKFLALLNPKEKDYTPAGFVTPEFLKQTK